MSDKVADTDPGSRDTFQSSTQTLAIKMRMSPKRAVFPYLPLDEIHPLTETQILKGATHQATEAVSDGMADQLFYIFVLSGVIENQNTISHQTTVIPDGGAGAVINHPASLLKITGGCRWLAFQIPLALIRSQFGLWSGKFCFHEPGFSTVPDFRKHAISSLYHTINLLMAKRGEAETSLLDASYEQLLITQLYAAAPHNLRIGSRSALRPCPKQLRRAEDFIRNNLYAPLTVDNIANAAGCSTRTLQRIFRHFRDATPIQILSRYRIAEARDLIATGKVKTVTDIAASLQFSNPARFAITYREVYGQRPSNDIRSHAHTGMR